MFREYEKGGKETGIIKGEGSGRKHSGDCLKSIVAAIYERSRRPMPPVTGRIVISQDECAHKHLLIARPAGSVDAYSKSSRFLC